MKSLTGTGSHVLTQPMNRTLQVLANWPSMFSRSGETIKLIELNGPVEEVVAWSIDAQFPTKHKNPWELQWLYIARKVANGGVSVDVSFLKRVSVHLQTYTYLANTDEPSVSDVLLYFSVMDAVHKHHASIQKDVVMYPLYRWLNTMQHWEAISEKLQVHERIPLPPAMPSKGPKAVSVVPISAGDPSLSKKLKDIPKTEKAKPVISNSQPEGFDALQLIVGKVVEIRKHEEADSLYVEKIDLGESSGPRQIISGLVKWLPMEDMLGRMVVVLGNLKTAKMRGLESQGMVMCVVNSLETELEPLAPPSGACIGNVLSLLNTNSVGATRAPPVISSKKLPELIAGLGTDNNGRAIWKPTGSIIAVDGKELSSRIPSGIIR